MVKNNNLRYIGFILLVLMIVVLPAKALTLEEAIELGLKNNSQIKAAQLDKEKARLDLELAKKAIYPELNLQSSYTRLGEAPQVPTGLYTMIPAGPDKVFLQPEMAEGPQDNYNTRLSFQQPIYLGGKIRLGLEMSRHNLELADIKLTKMENQVLFQIIQAYYNVLMARDRIGIEKEALKLVQEHKRNVQASIEAGMALKTDLLQIEIEESKGEQRLKDAQNKLNLARKSLANIIGARVETVSVPRIEPELKLDYDYLYQIARKKNPDILQMNLSKKLLNTNLEMEKASKKPSVMFMGNYSWQGSEFALKDGSWNLTLSTSLTLFDGGKTGLKEEKIDRDLSILQENQKNLSKMLALEIEQRLLDAQLALDNIELQKLNVSKARENLELETKRFEVGLGTNVDILNAQTTLKQVQLALMQAEYQYKLNLYSIMEKTGQLRDYIKEVLNNED